MSNNTLPATGIRTDQLSSMLTSFTIRHAAKQLPELLNAAEEGQMTHKEFLYSIMMAETKGRNERRLTRNYAAAHFPPNPKSLEEYDPAELESGITAGQIRQLKELNWLDTHGNIIFAGPPGLGKTMLAVGLGLEAVNAGYTVCFERMTNLIHLMDASDTERSACFRMKNIRRADLIIIDEIGYTPITRSQANAFYGLISDAYTTASIILTTNKDVSRWPEILGDRELTAALLDRLISHARCFSLNGTSYRMKHREQF